MKTVVALWCLAVAVRAIVPLPDHVKPIIEEGGKQYKLYKELVKEIELTNHDQDEAFAGMNIGPPADVIDEADLHTFYWHNDVKYAVNRFISFFEGERVDKKVKQEQLTDVFGSEPVGLALDGCRYFKAKGQRQSCFADQFLTYFALILDAYDVNIFYKKLAGNDNKLTIDEVKNWVKMLNKDSKYDPVAIAEELGAHSGNEVTTEEFELYVIQGTINDDFRRCRSEKPEDNGSVEFNNDCLLDELLKYINDDLTDMDIAVLFRAVDVNGNGKITLEEIQNLPGSSSDVVAQKIMALLDMSITTQGSENPIVDFSEFRTYMRSPTVLVQLERECTEKKVKQADELECLFDLFLKLVTQEHDAIWLKLIPDLEKLIAFEILDKNDDGVIKEDELPFADKDAKKRFIQETDTLDAGETVDLEEFNKYMDLPHMVYGIGDCLLKKNNIGGRGACYPDEIGQIMTNIKDVTDAFLDKWFGTYDTDGDGIITEKDANEAANKFGNKELEDLFLSELGQGDKSVTKFEFKWYVKQQELAEKYADNFVETKPDVERFHKDLKEWIEEHMTEYDIQQFFANLDTNHDHELEQKDFKDTVWAKVKDLITKIDSFGSDIEDRVNFVEFWLWLNSYHSKGRAPKPLVKHIFERDCTKKLSGPNKQADEIKCYVSLIKTKPEKLVESN